MTYSTVPDKAVNDTFTEAMWDTYIKDNLNAAVTRPIAETDLGAASTIDWQSIPATFSHLLLIGHVRGDNASVDRAIQFTLNNDGAGNYYGERISAQSTTLASDALTGQGAGRVGPMPGASATANHFAGFALFVADYSGTSYKACYSLTCDSTGTSASNQNLEVNAFIWRSTAVVNRLILKTDVGSLAIGSKATLYGMGGI